METKGITISQIAAEAGVSKTTVSRYLNGKYEFMSADTKEKISCIIEKTGYHPNRAARSLKNRKSMLIGLVVADIESPFSAAVIKSVSDVAVQAGYHVIAVNSDNSIDKENKMVQSLVRQQIDGLIVNTSSFHNPFLSQTAKKTPTVLLDRLIENSSLDFVGIENIESIKNAVVHLRKSGYDRLALFTEDFTGISPRFQRREAFLKSGGSDVFTVDVNSTDSVENAVCRLMTATRNDKMPPAIIASNGVTMVSCVKAIRNLNLKMPHIGLCGYDDWGRFTDMGLAGFIDVGITTFAADVSELGVCAANMLLERIEGKYIGEKRIVQIPTELIQRKSTQLKI